MIGFKNIKLVNKGHTMKKIPFDRLLNGIVLICMVYMLFVQPNLNSATPFRDILKDIIEHLLPIFLTVSLVFFCELKLIMYYTEKYPESFSIKWNETVPPETTRLIFQSIFIIVIGIMIGFFGFSWVFKQLSNMIFS